MTAFQRPSFSVNPSDAKAPKDCKHGWVHEKSGRCVLCGERVYDLSKWQVINARIEVSG